ncbi:transposase [Streptomyces sp. BE147]|uniref:transposase n=1 Tax=Streptomyces sp. BE147 TaxID=3002524 RepID=UPI002E767814|nr:transposase [Streptomyces sp. BE147]MEE1736228.1 transposase [Streptomyces sp. BE147]
MARFTKNQCRPCPARARCTSTAGSVRTVGFSLPPPRELRDLQLRIRTEQQTPEWKARYAVRSGVEGTVNEFTHGHGCGVPLQRTGKGPRPAPPDGHRCQHRAPQRTVPDWGNLHAPPADRLPEPPRPAQDSAHELLAHPGHPTSATSRSRTESSPVMLGVVWAVRSGP